MIIEERFELPAPPDEVADGFLDVVTLVGCVPGVRAVQALADDRYEAVLEVQLGPVRAAFAGEVRLDRSAAPRTIRASGTGVDRGSGSTATVEVVADLHATSGGTEVVTRADVALRGRLGQFGSGIIRATSGELLRQFVDCYAARLAARPAGLVGGPEPAGGGPGAVAAVTEARPLTLWRLLVATVTGLVRGWRARAARLLRRRARAGRVEGQR